MTASASCAPRRFRGDDGVVVVEAALAFPVLLLIMCGIVDFGGGLRNRINVQGSVRVAARIAANVGSDNNFKHLADQQAMSGLWAGLSNLVSNVTLQKAIVYKASYSSPQPTNGCKSASPVSGSSGVAGVCNVYSKAAVENSGTTWSTSNSSCSSGWDRYYCPRTRANTLTAPGGPDYLGIWVRVTYTPYTQMFGTSFQMDDYEVVRIEPQPV